MAKSAKQSGSFSRHASKGFLFACLALPLMGCEAEAPAADAADPGKVACAALATRLCAIQLQCTPATLPIHFGDVATCEKRQAARCELRLAAPETSRTAASVATCAASLAAVDCQFQGSFDSAEGCRAKPGLGEHAAPCVDDGQCKSSYCHIKDAYSACGTCMTRAKVAEQCTLDAECEQGLVCVATKSVKRCVQVVAAAAKCDAERVCGKPFFCVQGICQAGAKAGATCDNDVKNCDSGVGLRCNPVTEKCEAQAIADPFQKCGYFDGKYILCGYGGRCANLVGGKGTCEVVPDDGGACTTSEQTPCRALAACHAGKCGMVDAKACK